MRRELHLPMIEEDSNAPDHNPVASDASTQAQSASSNLREKVNTGLEYADKVRGTPVISQPSASNQRKKNKNHQSPIASDSSQGHNASQNQKKARLFSPKSSLPPKKNNLGDLFTCPLDDSVFDSSANKSLLNAVSDG